MYYDTVMAGFGGQGILMIGNLLAVAGIHRGLKVTFFPSYGVEMRGGTANCTVTLADRDIGSPVTARPMGVIAMNEPSAAKFAPRIRAGGVLVTNASLISDAFVPPAAAQLVAVPCNEMAHELGDARLASMIALGAFVTATGVVELGHLEQALPEVLPEKAHKLIPLNVQALAAGAERARAVAATGSAAAG